MVVWIIKGLFKLRRSDIMASLNSQDELDDKTMLQIKRM